MLNVVRMLTCRFAVSIPRPGVMFWGSRQLSVAFKGLMTIALSCTLICCNHMGRFMDPGAPERPAFFDAYNNVYTVKQFDCDCKNFNDGEICSPLNLAVCQSQPSATQCEQCREIRNRIVGGTILQIDRNYREFIDFFYAGTATLETLSDVTVLGLTTAGTLASGAALKAILSAAAAGVTGTRLSVSTNLFKQQATDVFLNAMSDLRTQKRYEIEDKLQEPISQYSLYQAFDDLVAYYDAGTIRAAYQGLQSSPVALKSAAKQPPDVKTELVKACATLSKDDSKEPKAETILKTLGIPCDSENKKDCFPLLVQTVVNTVDPVTLDRIKNAFDSASNPDSSADQSSGVKTTLVKDCATLNKDKLKESKAQAILEVLGIQCNPQQNECFPLLTQTVIDTSDLNTLEKIKNAFDILGKPD